MGRMTSFACVSKTITGFGKHLKISILLRLEDVCRHGYSNNHLVKVTERPRSWLKEANMTKQEMNSGLRCWKSDICCRIHPPRPHRGGCCFGEFAEMTDTTCFFFGISSDESQTCHMPIQHLKGTLLPALALNIDTGHKS